MENDIFYSVDALAMFCVRELLGSHALRGVQGCFTTTRDTVLEEDSPNDGAGHNQKCFEIEDVAAATLDASICFLPFHHDRCFSS